MQKPVTMERRILQMFGVVLIASLLNSLTGSWYAQMYGRFGADLLAASVLRRQAVSLLLIPNAVPLILAAFLRGRKALRAVAIAAAAYGLLAALLCVLIPYPLMTVTGVTNETARIGAMHLRWEGLVMAVSLSAGVGLALLLRRRPWWAMLILLAAAAVLSMALQLLALPTASAVLAAAGEAVLIPFSRTVPMAFFLFDLPDLQGGWA